jgi:translocation and assembly module TamB
MRRWLKILCWALGALIVVPALLLGLVIGAGNVDWGRRLIEHGVGALSGGDLTLAGLSGRFPADLRVAHAELRKGGTLWLVADDLALQWSPSRLFHNEIGIASLRAGRLQLLERPIFGGSRTALPRIDVESLDVERFDIAAALAGAAASVSARGDARYASLDDAAANLTVTRLDAPGTYVLHGRIAASAIQAELSLDEPSQGLLSGLAGVPDLGAISARASFDGPRGAEALRFTLAAGELRAEGHGLVDLERRNMDLDVTASAPAMAPRPDVRWQSVALQAHLHGPFTEPDASGTVRIDDLIGGDARVRSVRAELQGNRGAIALHAVLEGLRVPGSRPALFEATPVELNAQARLDDATRPVTFTVNHPLLAVQGRANAGGEPSAVATLTAASLAPFAALAGIDLRGRANLEARASKRGDAIDVQLTGTVGLTGGAAPLPALVGSAGKIDIAVELQGESITIQRAQLDGRAVRVSAQGTSARDALDLRWTIALPELAALSNVASGRIDAKGRLQGPRTSFAVSADATGELATHGAARAPVEATIALRGLPDAPSGTIEASASVDGSPLRFAVALDRARDGAWQGTIQRADWKSAHAQGEATLRSGERWPRGHATLSVAQLEDLRPWLDESVRGSLNAQASFAPSGSGLDSTIAVDVRNGGASGIEIEHLALNGTVKDAGARPSVALRLAADGIAASGVTGNARLQANGPLHALKVELTAGLHHETLGDVPLGATGTLDAEGKSLALATLHAQLKDERLQLLAPARCSFGDGVAVDRLRVGLDQAVLEIAGRVSPALDLTASLHNATPALARAFGADVAADGTFTMDARLSGTLSDPRGTVKLAASALRLRTSSARSLPPASLTATADLDGQSAHVAATLSAGNRMHLEAGGRVPFQSSGAIDLHARGNVDAALANPVLEVNGRRVKGVIALDLGVGGTLAAPRLEGTARVSGGELQDYALGVALTRIDALLEASGDTVRLASLTAQAGAGTISATGTVGAFVTGIPIDLTITARNAKPFASDLLTADLDADITLRGQATTRLDAAGRITVHRAEITIPKALPRTVAVLDVRRPGQKPPAPRAPGLVVGLDLTIDAPRAVFVRGRGLDAETGGELRLQGTTASPRVSGGFDLRRGSFDLGGASLNFTSGRVSFAGTGLSQKVDPTLDFRAESTNNDVTARLAITGYADAPTIALTSTPELPQDEILARLLFGVSAKQLSPLQLAQIAAAVASIAGIGGENNPLSTIQKSLGLDRLSAGSTPTGGTTIEAGRYVAEGVYVGAKQSTQGGTQAQVQIDLTKRLKLQATLGTGGTVPVQGATPENDPGSSIGLSYQFEY